jgi:phytoene dehydrogenase-like protein
VTPDVLFVGGGIIGLSSAWRAAHAGLQVTVFDPAPGAAASNVAAGMLAPVTEVEYGEEDRLALNVAAARRWPTFAAELEAATDADLGYRATGTLLVGFDRDDVAALSDLHAFQTELGLEVEQLRSREARAREPMLSPRVRVGLLAGEDHRVEPRACVAALLRACAEVGVDFEHRKVARIEKQRGQVTGVRTADGEQHHGGQVVMARSRGKKGSIGLGSLAFQYPRGLYRRGPHYLHVTSGVGSWFPLRLRCPAEVVLLTLHAVHPADIGTSRPGLAESIPHSRRRRAGERKGRRDVDRI